jgi:Flp pilus assembly protein TadG
MSASSTAARVGFRASDRGASAVEFALIFPLLVMLTFGILEFGFILYQMNMMEKATQLGARIAVTGDPVATGLTAYTAQGTGLAPGSPLPAGLQSEIVCMNASPCTGTGAITNPGYSATAFTAIVTEMQRMYPGIGPENVVVTYRNVGLGFVGRPGGAIVPAVTVSLRDMTYDFIIMDAIIELFGPPAMNVADILYPSFNATLTGEDLNDGA